MLSWILNKFRRKDSYDTYSPSERALFRFWNGERFISADPMVLYKRLVAKGADLDIASTVSSNSMIKQEVAMKAHDDLIRYIRDIFELKKPAGLDCTGTLDETACVDLLNSFYIYCGSVKKKLSPTQTSVKETSASSASTSDANPPTLSTSDSGSAANEPPTANQTPSAVESSLPSA